MWAFGLVNCGNYGMVVPCGNDGAQKLRNKTLRGWKSETSTMQKCVDEVYVLPDFSQKMCEMSERQLADYVMKTGRRIK